MKLCISGYYWYYIGYEESSTRVNVSTTSPKCLETKNPTNVGLSVYYFFSLIASVIADAKSPVGIATTPNPINTIIVVNIFPPIVIG